MADIINNSLIQGDGDYLTIIYLWSSQDDLDTCTYLSYPTPADINRDYGIDTKYMAPCGYGWHGWGYDYPTTIEQSTPYIMQGVGDRQTNFSSGDPDSIECTIINIAAIKKLYTDYPDMKNKYPYFDISANIHWYYMKDVENPDGIDIRYDLFKGGTISLDIQKHHININGSTHVTGKSYSSIFGDSLHNVFVNRNIGTTNSEWITGQMDKVSNELYCNVFTLRLDMSDTNNPRIYIIKGKSNGLSCDDLCAVSLFGMDIFNGNIFNGTFNGKNISDMDWHQVFNHTDDPRDGKRSKGITIKELKEKTLSIYPITKYDSNGNGIISQSANTYDGSHIYPDGTTVNIDSSINTKLSGRTLRTGDITPYEVYISEFGKQQNDNKLIDRSDITLRNNISSLLTTPYVIGLLYDLDILNKKIGDSLYLGNDSLSDLESIYYAVQEDPTKYQINKLETIPINSYNFGIDNNNINHPLMYFKITQNMLLTTPSGRKRILIFIKRKYNTEQAPNEWLYLNNSIYAVVFPLGIKHLNNACLYKNSSLRYIICSSDVNKLTSDCMAGAKSLKDIYFLCPNAPTLNDDGSGGFTFVDSNSSDHWAPAANVTIHYAKFSQGWTDGNANSAWSWKGIFTPANYGTWSTLAQNMSTWKLKELGFNDTLYSIWSNIIWNGAV